MNITPKKIQIKDTFWNYYRELVRTEMIPYQWKVLNDEIAVNIERERNDDSIPNEKSHAIENFKIAAGLVEGHHYGWVFQDSDVYKWLEAVAYCLQNNMDEDLKKLADSVVELIAEAQEESGYLSTYFTIEAPKRKFKRLSQSHELYCAGHFLEAAVAYYQATENETVLRCACKLADYIDDTFGEKEISLVDGHEEIEIGLMKLYHLTGNPKYLYRSQKFLMSRGMDIDYFNRQEREDGMNRPLIQGMEKFPPSYFQLHKPLLEQKTAEGHAVRLVYMCTAMADVAAETGNKEMLDACQNLWRNIVDKRMYITGGIGSTVIGESFTYDYDLPNDTMYCETCASVGLIFFARNMLKNRLCGEYADVMERALYNTVLAGMALDGKHFFYVNPLEVSPESSKKDPTKSHVKAVRPQWLGCACCPPNLARLLASLEQYIYTQNQDLIAIHLFMENEAVFEIDGEHLKISQKTDYPWNGEVWIEIESQIEREITLALRIPSWTNTYSVELDGKYAKGETKDGYFYMHCLLQRNKLKLSFPMEINRWYAASKVRDDIGKVCISRGPIVYCMEEVDNGKSLHLLQLEKDEALSYQFQKSILNGIGQISGWGTREIPYEKELGNVPNAAAEPLYYKNRPKMKKKSQRLTWIPYYAWANRGENEMQVWVRES